MDLPKLFKKCKIRVENIKTEKCVNCGCTYALKTGIPKLCWICGLPTGEKINEI